jgi:hypothetical protein
MPLPVKAPSLASITPHFNRLFYGPMRLARLARITPNVGREGAGFRSASFSGHLRKTVRDNSQAGGYVHSM